MRERPTTSSTRTASGATSSTQPGTASSSDEAIRRWADFLSVHKLRSTAPRRSILEGIARSPGHFDAETLRLRLKGQGRRLSRATIYRTLALLQKSGVLRRVQLVDGTLHYELARPNDPHHHLICRRCGSVQEVLDAGLRQAVVDVARRATFTPEEFSLRILGLCERCRERR